MATRIDADGTVADVAPANGRVFTLAELQGIVGGYIEVLADPDGRIMYLNEDGKRLALPINHMATARVRGRLRPDDYIVGTVLLCTRAETGDDDADQET